MKRSVLILLSMLTALMAMAQKATVSGVVVNGATGQVVSGASVTADGLSVVTNDDGFFILKTENQPAAVVVTHVGFRPERIVLNGKSAERLNIRLQPTAIQLREVLVIAEDPRELMETAISKIPKNYSQHPELYRCFYRETAMKRQHYICVAEGVVDMYKTSYSKGVRGDRVAIRKGRRLLSSKQGDTLGIKVMGGPVVPVQLDIVKNTEFLLNHEELDNYDFRMESPTTIGDRMQYVVAMKPRRVVSYALYNGKFYIDQETMAFTRAELTLDMSDRQKATNIMLIKKPAGVRFRPKELSLLIDYRNEGEVTRISYLRTTFRFNCDWKRRLFATSFAAFCEMAVTSKTSEDVQPISGRDSFDQRDAFFDKVDYFRDPTFWQDYNIIEPTESLDKAVLRLLRK